MDVISGSGRAPAPPCRERRDNRVGSCDRARPSRGLRSRSDRSERSERPEQGRARSHEPPLTVYSTHSAMKTFVSFVPWLFRFDPNTM